MDGPQGDSQGSELSEAGTEPRNERANGPRRERITIGIAEYDVSTDGTVLVTSGLGSCVAVALYDRGNGVGGLVHVMLPTAENRVADVEAKYADSGIEALLCAMERAGADRARIVAKIAGGSEMLSFGGDEPSIGSRNVCATEETLSRIGISLLGADVGGDAGRSIAFDPGTGEVVSTIARGGQRTL